MEPRHREDYSRRQVEAARRVLVDIGQVLASFADCLVVVGGWVPDLLLADAEEPHIGSIDVDLALDAAKLSEGRYAELLKLLLDTKRYRRGTKDFQLVVTVDLKDGERPVDVEIEFLAAREVKLRKNTPKLIPGFRVLLADGCSTAFHSPVKRSLAGKSVRGASNTVQLLVASLADFLIMKAHALAGRDKPKDAYDICYCLDQHPGGMVGLAAEWKERRDAKDVAKAIEILAAKFMSVDAYGPQQLVEFHNSPDDGTQAMQARRAYELVQKFLALV